MYHVLLGWFENTPCYCVYDQLQNIPVSTRRLSDVLVQCWVDVGDVVFKYILYQHSLSHTTSDGSVNERVTRQTVIQRLWPYEPF